MATPDPIQTIIDSHFFVPAGSVDIRQQNNTDSEFIYTALDTASDNNQPTLGTPVSVVPMPPTSFEIVSQRVRISASGTAVVDVTLQFPDIPGVDHIDVRITKSA